jgi:hypothetical protein
MQPIDFRMILTIVILTMAMAFTGGINQSSPDAPDANCRHVYIQNGDLPSPSLPPATAEAMLACNPRPFLILQEDEWVWSVTPTGSSKKSELRIVTATMLVCICFAAGYYKASEGCR